MVKIVGKLWLLLGVIIACNSISLYAAKLTLGIISTDGFILKQVEAGKPFILEVSVEGTANTQRPDIAGLETFYMGQSGFQMKTVNGQSSVKHTLHVRIDEPGEYTIGPAVLEHRGRKLRSNKIEVTVADKQLFKNGAPQTKPGVQKVFFKLKADKKNVVVGEKVNCRLRFYMLHEAAIRFNSASTADIKTIKKTKEMGPAKGEKEINGSRYNYLEWKWAVYPKKAGIITLPAYRALYEERVKNNVFGGFSMFFGDGYETKDVFSNALTLQVQPLPKYDKPVHATGEFISFEASVDRAAAKQGDGIVYALEIEGAGDLEDLEYKELSNMPENMRYYDSKSMVLDNSAKQGMKKKRFEFIVQGMEPGEYEIPVQEFTFFDTNVREYKTLKTSPLLLQILKASPQSHLLPQQSSQDVNSVSGAQESKVEDAVPPIALYKELYEHTERKIPFWMFMLLFLAPLFFFGFAWAKKTAKKVCAYYTPQLTKKYAFLQAIKALHYAKKKKDFACIYSIFITLFAQRLELNESLITQDKIIEILQERGFAQGEINRWEYFVGKISSYVFYEVGAATKPDISIFVEAENWIHIFKKKI